MRQGPLPGQARGRPAAVAELQRDPPAAPAQRDGSIGSHPGLKRTPSPAPEASQTDPRASEKLALNKQRDFILSGHSAKKLRLSSHLEVRKNGSG